MRIRSIKPEFYTSEAIAELSIEEAFFFQGLWLYCDDEGRGKDDGRLIKAALFPLRDSVTASTVDALLEALALRGRIVRYSVDGRRYFEVVNFTEHQRPNRRVESRLPAPDHPNAVREQCASSAKAVIERDALTPVEEGRGTGDGGGEGEGEGGKKNLRSPGGARVRLWREEFEVLWQAYPKRPNNSKSKARRAYEARRNAGVPAEDLLRGVEAYAAYVEREGVEPRFVKHASTFLGVDEHWLTDFGAPASKKIWPYVNERGEPDPDGDIPNPEFLRVAGMLK